MSVYLRRILSLVGSPRYRRALTVQVAAFVVITGVAGGSLSLTWPDAPVHIHVRWKADMTDAERIRLERAFHLANSLHSEGTTWDHQLANPSTTEIRAIVQNARVDDSSHRNRARLQLGR